MEKSLLAARALYVENNYCNPTYDMLIIGIVRLLYDNVFAGKRSMKTTPKAQKATFETMLQLDVPQSRNGKHRQIVRAILGDVALLQPGAAVKVPLSALKDTKENVRSALSRESKKRKLPISTAADSGFLYVWRAG